jgi:hypothetical protein
MKVQELFGRIEHLLMQVEA